MFHMSVVIWVHRCVSGWEWWLHRYLSIELVCTNVVSYRNIERESIYKKNRLSIVNMNIKNDK